MTLHPSQLYTLKISSARPTPCVPPTAIVRTSCGATVHIFIIYLVQVGQSFKTVGYGCTSCWGDVEAGDAEEDVIYISFIVSVQHIRVLSTVLTQGTKGQRGQLNQGVQC